MGRRAASAVETPLRANDEQAHTDRTCAAEREERLIRSLLRSPEVLKSSYAEQLLASARFRREIMEEFGGLSSRQVAEVAHSTSGNPAALANSWKAARKIFAVDFEGVRFPAFQFDEQGKTREVIGRVIEAVGDVLSGWDLCLWFCSANGYLDGARPVDLLEDTPDEVVEAARRSVEPVVF